MVRGMRAAPGLSVPRVHFCAVDEPNEAETDGQEPSAQEITQGSEVGDGEIIRVQSLPPHQAHNQVSHVEQDPHLREARQALL